MGKNAEAKVYLSNMKIWDPKNRVEVAPGCSLKGNLRWPGMQQLQKEPFKTDYSISSMMKELNEHDDKGPKKQECVQDAPG